MNVEISPYTAMTFIKKRNRAQSLECIFSLRKTEQRKGSLQGEEMNFCCFIGIYLELKLKAFFFIPQELKGAYLGDKSSVITRVHLV